MMKMRTTAGFLTAAALAFLLPTSAYATTVNDSPAGPDASDITVGEVYGSPEDSASESEVSTRAICVALNLVDYPHISTSRPGTPLAVQAHGGWNKGGCNATLADVTTQIDRKNPIGLFQAVGAQGKGRLPSQADESLPSSNRVTARYECNGTAGAPFRAWTNIDMVGLADTQTPTYSPATNDIACG